VKYLSTKAVAELLSVHNEHVLSLIHSGALKAFNVAARPGKPRWRIAQTDVDAFIRERQAKPPAVQPRRRRHNRTKGLIEFV